MPSSTRIDFISSPVSALNGRIHVPGDKSISHRAVILGAIAEGTTHISRMLRSADTIASITAFREMGVDIDDMGEDVTVKGVGLHGLKTPPAPLYFGNSGTSARLLAGILAAQKFDSELTGDESLMKRPMMRIVEPLRMMGAELDCGDTGTLPLKVTGGRQLTGIEYELPVASAQLKSCLLLAGLYAASSTRIIEPVITRDHTERMLLQFGGTINRKGNTIHLTPTELKGCNVHVPGDISSAAFFIVATCIKPGSEIVLEDIGINPTRSAVIEILQAMGADIKLEEKQTGDAEPVADIIIRSSRLKGITIPRELVSIAIDEFPCIMIAAAYAEGRTVLSNASELRVKESDRIEAISQGLSQIGVEVETREDGITVTGGTVRGGEVDSYGDHRIAMAFAVAAVEAESAIRIRNCVNVNTSFPDFVEMATLLGLDIEVQDIHV